MCMQFFVKYFSLFSFPMQYNYQEKSQLVGCQSDQQWSFPPEIGIRNWFAFKSQEWFVLKSHYVNKLRKPMYWGNLHYNRYINDVSSVTYIM